MIKEERKSTGDHNSEYEIEYVDEYDEEEVDKGPKIVTEPRYQVQPKQIDV